MSHRYVGYVLYLTNNLYTSFVCIYRVFNEFRTVHNEVAKELTLDNENIQIAVEEENIDYLKKAFQKGTR